VCMRPGAICTAGSSSRTRSTCDSVSIARTHHKKNSFFLVCGRVGDGSHVPGERENPTLLWRWSRPSRVLPVLTRAHCLLRHGRNAREISSFIGTTESFSLIHHRRSYRTMGFVRFWHDASLSVFIADLLGTWDDPLSTKPNMVHTRVKFAVCLGLHGFELLYPPNLAARLVALICKRGRHIAEKEKLRSINTKPTPRRTTLGMVSRCEDCELSREPELRCHSLRWVKRLDWSARYDGVSVWQGAPRFLMTFVSVSSTSASRCKNTPRKCVTRPCATVRGWSVTIG
jgi:hypothetical protein